MMQYLNFVNGWLQLKVDNDSSSELKKAKLHFLSEAVNNLDFLQKAANYETKKRSKDGRIAALFDKNDLGGVVSFLSDRILNRLPMLELQIAFGNVVQGAIHQSKAEWKTFVEKYLGRDFSPDSIVKFFPLPSDVGNFSSGSQAMTAGANGGIDLMKTQDRTLVKKDGQGVQMRLDPAMIERVKREGINFLTPVIFKVTPLVNIGELLGLNTPLLPHDSNIALK